ncbi:2-polyprenyl-6-methoxyphenol hydroxylase-like FAD-dependent oxidoreductase [Nonomuraea polychroma]|uniref:2-polyprenyl-6-methoxyphenol hydroxylase-like FAD-dependent oxidoreductase n=1 Tax=Nonomuraea polychroma TaxID=46176 RepID=A0A438MK70_9ACTN|nr:FAD-dependent monooxygenase [Nonomuraea polychroma]RVX45895.1 2-polyprenyl-6-methoxyphenol hydroxylase-like FAD-dependent oxidoreductase [Nonomuraea polychroma]
MKALVIGCGIAGPVTAMALREVGIEAEIFEAYGQGAENVGSFLNIASNGLAALRVLGAHRQVLDTAIPTPRMVMWSGSGKRLGEVANGLRLDDGTVSHTVQRSDLYRTIRDEAVERGIHVHHGKRLTAFEDHGSEVTARFEDGSEATGDLLIACDGVHSRTRAILDPQAPAPRYSGLYSFGGIVKGGTLAGEPGEYHMVFGKHAFFGYSVAESGETWWFANLPRRLGDVPESWRPELVKAFEDDANASAELIGRSEVGMGLPIHDLPPVPVWHRGRVLLLGDAAHATSPSAGQGASLAIEDAIVLARCLRDSRDHREAFERYEAERRPRVERVVAYSRTISNSKAAGPVARVFRDLMLPIFLKKSASQESLSWMYRYQASL